MDGVIFTVCICSWVSGAIKIPHFRAQKITHTVSTMGDPIPVVSSLCDAGEHRVAESGLGATLGAPEECLPQLGPPVPCFLRACSSRQDRHQREAKFHPLGPLGGEGEQGHEAQGVPQSHQGEPGGHRSHDVICCSSEWACKSRKAPKAVKESFSFSISIA